MHYYEDKDFDYWDELDQAAEFIGKYCHKWGRISVRQYKEKYGTVRVYCSFGCESLHKLIYPGYCRVRWPYQFWTFPIFSWLQPLVLRWQKFIYRRAYGFAIEKWPMIKEEILCCADWDEYLGGL